MSRRASARQIFAFARNAQEENQMEVEVQDKLETKAGIPHESIVTHGEMMRAFYAFKEANDARLAGIERFNADVLLEEKLARIDRAIDGHTQRLDEISLKRTRPPMGCEGQRRAFPEHKAAFDAYIRSGDSQNLRALELKALSSGSNPDGGFVVPPEIEAQISRRLTSISPVRSIASVRVISSNVYKKPFMTAGPAVGWAGDLDARAQTASPILDELSFPAMELYAMPAATATLLEDSAVNIDEWIAGEVEQAFAAQEGTAFVSGDGSNKPKGFLSYLTVAESAWVWGKLGFIITGADGAF